MEGELFVSDAESDQVLVLDARRLGEAPLRTLGGPGDMPGELSQPRGLALWHQAANQAAATGSVGEMVVDGGKKRGDEAAGDRGGVGSDLDASGRPPPLLLVCEYHNNRVSVFGSRDGGFVRTFGDVPTVGGTLPLRHPFDVLHAGELLIVSEYEDKRIVCFRADPSCAPLQVLTPPNCGRLGGIATDGDWIIAVDPSRSKLHYFMAMACAGAAGSWHRASPPYVRGESVGGKRQERAPLPRGTRLRTGLLWERQREQRRGKRRRGQPRRHHRLRRRPLCDGGCWQTWSACAVTAACTQVAAAEALEMLVSRPLQAAAGSAALAVPGGNGRGPSGSEPRGGHRGKRRGGSKIQRLGLDWHERRDGRRHARPVDQRRPSGAHASADTRRGARRFRAGHVVSEAELDAMSEEQAHQAIVDKAEVNLLRERRDAGDVCLTPQELARIEREDKEKQRIAELAQKLAASLGSMDTSRGADPFGLHTADR